MKTIVQKIKDGEVIFSRETADDLFIKTQYDFAETDLELEDYIGISSEALGKILFAKSDFFTEVSKQLKITKEKLVASISEEEINDLFEMSNLREKSTGIKNVIWVSAKNANHGARVKVQWGDSIRETVSVSLHKTNPTVVAGNEADLDASILAEVKQWIIENYAVLMQYWNMEIDTADMIAGLKKIS